ncbi:unnamed protein product [Echinostoma caproni]|uniref:G_PROTEIN_RECEP_F1_2 domain-containing protein n=1 Tax=Echinostoma caproni TaxID=27848 RepID=A0A183A523_9TREM|nr:unnamed protein product [Echinostoma caproni]
MDSVVNQSLSGPDRFTLNWIGRITLASLVCLLDLWILTANAFVLFSLGRGVRSRLNVTRKLLINLACADLAIGLFVIPWSIATELFDWTVLSSSAVCHWGLSLDIFFSTTSMYSLTVIAIDQYVGVCYALRYNQMLTDTRVTILISIPWVISLINALPMMGFAQWYIILRPAYTDHHFGAFPSTCSLHNAGTFTRIYWCLLGFSPPLTLVLYSHYNVCKRVIQNIREQHSGIIKDKEELIKLKSSSNSKGSPTSAPQESKVSSMRVHIGGQPCYMKLNQNQTKNGGSEIFAHLPSTLKCGFLIMSTSIPTKKGEKSQTGPDRKSPYASGGTHTGQSKINSMQSLNKSRSGSGLYGVLNGDDSQDNEFSISKRNSVDNQSTSLLKPPKWLPSRSFSRKSDSEFASLRAMRRCALMPLQPRMQHSASTEITTTADIEIGPSTTNNNNNNNENKNGDTGQSNLIRSSANTIAVASFSDAPFSAPEPRLKRELKAVYQFGVNCAVIVCGWIPFILVHLVHAWLPRNTMPQLVLHWFYWIRFLCTALNPLVCGSASEELRKAFRNLIYCGRPKQEKKALKRLVLAGLGAAGLSYGRPIIPVDVRKTPLRTEPVEV